MEDEFGDMRPVEPSRVVRKSDRLCNNPHCRRRLTESAPNWFQCSESCRRAVWELNHPRSDDD